MDEKRSSSFWARVVALITGCAVVGAVVGAVAGLVIGQLSRGISFGIATGAVVAVALVFWLPDGTSRRGRDER